MYRLLALLLVLAPVVAQDADPLPSWNDTKTKRAIIDFVRAATDPNNAAFVKAEDRIAVFDNDGTLWCEKPLYIHFFATLKRMRQQIAADASLATRQPYKAVATKNHEYFYGLYENMAFETLVGDIMAVPYGGMTAAAWETQARAHLANWKHPKRQVGYEKLVYAPMLELLRFLRAHGFLVYVSTADEAAFVRLVSNELYKVPPERVLGSAVRHEYVLTNGKPQFVRTYRAEYFNNWDGKPRLIQRIIGKKPVFAAGNSNGDRHMLQYAAGSGGFALLLHHTDAEREYKYDSHTEKVMPMAKKGGWTVIDMKADWTTVFPK